MIEEDEKKRKEKKKESLYSKLRFTIAMEIALGLVVCPMVYLGKKEAPPPAALPLLAVGPFTAAGSGGGAKAAAVTARNLVESRLTAENAYRIIPGGATDSLLAGLDIQADDISGKESVRKLYFEDIRYIVTGEVDAEESGYTITLKTLHLATGRFFHQGGGYTDGAPGEFYTEINALADQFAAGLAGSREELAETPLYKIGDEGPGGGMIFFARDGVYRECSGEQGTDYWERAMSAAEHYRGGGYTDWRLPTMGELWSMYHNLKAGDNPGGFSDGTYWSSGTYTEFSYNRRNRPVSRRGPDRGVHIGRDALNFGAGKSTVERQGANHIRFVRSF